MNELGIATEASDKMVLAVNSHLNEGNIEEAVAIFSNQFGSGHCSALWTTRHLSGPLKRLG